MVKLTDKEERLLQMIKDKSGDTMDEVIRRSEREFDLLIKGKRAEGYAYSARLDLYAISELINWTKASVARMTNLGGMVLQGDWSGIRDSEEHEIEAIFKKHILPLIKKVKA